ncbi:MAG: 23S rRNA (guanosine(2251)-2'-O)-methyltransferase RlmB [Leptospiraceae bacterium]|nr:23S rRNA (guanosine(2251)-2'-O)-methyltransferase RlmB [Leptospiraceae bacterium]MCP5511830.1 23S rRNA (guanosine(2251)-2'-O)-methyltransferase RlmB [Leptospiraceae bacterium]
MEKKINSKVIFGRRNTTELVTKLIKDRTPVVEWPFREVLVKKNANKDIKDSILRFLPREIKISFLSGGDMDALVPGKNHQGVIFLAKERSGKDPYLPLQTLIETIEKKKVPLLVLDRIMDTGNFGSILRTAECLGIQNIIVPERDMAPVNETVEKISSGALHHLHLYRVTNLSTTMEKLKSLGYWVVTTGETGSEDWSKLPEPNEIVVIIGNEENGVKKILIEKGDFHVRIPLGGKVASLNAGVACGIVLDRIMNRIKNPV